MAALSPLFVDKKGGEIELNEDDIPGAKLPKPVLKRWLSCRGAKVSGSRRKVSFQFEVAGNCTFCVQQRLTKSFKVSPKHFRNLTRESSPCYIFSQ